VREVKKIWVGLTPAYIQSLYNSIPRRIRSVIVAKGHITKYWKWQVCSKINLKNTFPIFPYAYIPQVMRWRPSWWNNYGHLHVDIVLINKQSLCVYMSWFIDCNYRKCDLLLQLHFEFSLKLSYTSSKYKLELVQLISFSPPSQEFFYLKCHI
jgi:hypothetical protein